MAIEVKTQAQLDKALKANPGGEISLVGKIAFVLQLTGAVSSPTLIVQSGAKLDAASYSGARIYIDARGNSTVTAWENSTVTAWGNSTVTARENSTVTAWENSTVTARGYAFVRAFSSKKVEASENCIVALHQIDAAPGGVPGVSGGRQMVCPPPVTGQAWCDHYGVSVVDGVATLYKAVNISFRSDRGGDYTPGTVPAVAIFKAEPECAAGALYFSPDPHFTHEFVMNPARYVACPVAVADIVTHPNGQYPAKVKAKGCCAPVYECDINGKPVVPVGAAAQ